MEGKLPRSQILLSLPLPRARDYVLQAQGEARLRRSLNIRNKFSQARTKLLRFRLSPLSILDKHYNHEGAVYSTQSVGMVLTRPPQSLSADYRRPRLNPSASAVND